MDAVVPPAPAEPLAEMPAGSSAGLAAAERPLEGEVVALTGRLGSLTRSEAVELIQAHGGVYAPRATRRTSLLVLGREGLPLGRDGRLSGKLRLARRLERRGHPIEVLLEEQFLQRLGLTASERPACGRHTLGELVRIVGVPRDRLRGWLRAGLVRPAEVVGTLAHFEFGEVALVKQLGELTEAGVSTARLRRSLRQLGRWLPDAREALARLDLLAGLLVVRREDGRPVEAGGQLLFDFGTTGEADAAALRLSAAAAGRPHSVPPTDASEELFQQGVRLEQAGEHAQAAAVYRRWLLEHGPSPPVCFNLGNVLSALGRREAAIERYRQTVELDPLYAQAWNNLGDALAESGDEDAALAAWRRAVEADPQCAEALYNLADALQSAGQRIAARRYWRAYLRCDGQSEWAAHARACLAGEGA